MISFNKIAPALCLFAGTALFAQTPLQFEVASVKMSEPIMQLVQAGKIPKGGLSVEGTRAFIGVASVGELIAMAYEVKSFQVTGPDWLNASPMTADRFNIEAKMPAGTTKEQIPEMLRGLLAERFGLKIHKTSKDQDVYVLSIAKTGLKMKEAAAPDPAEAARAGLAIAGTGGMRQTGNGMEVDGGNGNKMTVTVDDQKKIHMKASKMAVPQMIEAIAKFIDKPVVDQTGLKASYEMELVMSMDDVLKVQRSMGMQMPGQPVEAAKPGDAASDPGSSSIFTSVQALGLKLDPKKAPLEMVVVDRVEKAPTEN